MTDHIYRHALVVGGTGGIGAALIAEISRRGLAGRLSAWARHPGDSGPAPVSWRAVDVTDEDAVRSASEHLDDVDLVLVAIGILHGDSPGGVAIRPEKTIRALDPAAMAYTFAINTIAPALVAKHVLPRFPRDRRAVFAALSARVGSIGDNRLGGWYSYRASKAALNQIIRTASIELAVRHPLAVCVGLHPGTVDTPLSKPFQGGRDPHQLFPPDRAAAHLLDVVARLTPSGTGECYDWKGEAVPA